MDKSKIKKEAKEILDKFAGALARVEGKVGKGDSFVDRDEFERVEGSSECSGFKDKLLENAPQHDDDFVIAERGGWR